MLPKYTRKATIAMWIWFASVFLLVVLLPIQSAKENTWNNDIAAIFAIAFPLTIFGIIGYGFWAFSKAKGYSGLMGILLTIFTILGLIILLILPDRHKEIQPTTLEVGIKTTEHKKKRKVVTVKGLLMAALFLFAFILMVQAMKHLNDRWVPQGAQVQQQER